MALDNAQKNYITKALRSERVFFNFEKYSDYTHDATEIVYFPEALFFAESEADVIAACNVCCQLGLPLVVRGAGTGYSGGALTVNGGLLVSIERMNSIEINAKNKTAVVGSGAITGDIMNAAEQTGLFYPPDPASYMESTIGGNVAENAGGLRCKKYGVTRDYVLSVRGIDAFGNVTEVNHRSPFGLLDLLIGSEGTLFVFTEITLRLIELPEPGKTIQATFGHAVDAASVVSDITAAGIVPSIMEFMDGDAIDCSNQYDTEHSIVGGAGMLLFETDGSQAEQEAEAIMATCKKYSPVMLRMAENRAEREILWKTRRNLSNAVKKSAKAKISEDVCVPPSRLPELMDFVSELARTLTIRVNCYGHAGDGNLHVNFLGATGSVQEEGEIERGVKRLFEKTLGLDGTLSGEHGIGITKKDYLRHEFDPDTFRFMKRLMERLNPDGILNPGKIF